MGATKKDFQNSISEKKNPTPEQIRIKKGNKKQLL